MLASKIKLHNWLNVSWEKLPIKSSALTLLAIMLTASGCWSPKQELAQDGNQATFYVASSDGKSTGFKILDKNWNIPGEKSFRFWACLKDVVTRKELSNQKFVIENKDSISPFSKPATSSNNGCVYWSENDIAFDYFAPSKFLVFNRVIRSASSSVHKGVVSVRLMVNPWASFRQSKEEVIYWPENTQSPIDLSKVVQGNVAVREALMGIGTKREDHGKLYVENVSMLASKLADVYFTEKDKKNDELNKKQYDSNSIENDEAETHAKKADEVISGFDLEIHLDLKPVVQIKNIDGDIQYLPIKSGKFRVLAELVATELGEEANKNMMITDDKSKYGGAKDEREIMTPKAPPLEVEMHMGKLLPIIQATVTRKVTQGRLKLALQIRPISSPSKLEAYEGLYVIGDYKKLTGSSAPKLDKDTYYSGEQHFNFMDYMRGSAGFDELKETYAFNMKPFDFSVSRGNYVMVLPGETATQRTIVFRAETCIFDNATGTSRQQYKQFRIFRDGVEIPKEDARTNEEGCLILLGKVSHAFYKIEELKPTKFEIFYDAPNLVAKKNGYKGTGKGQYTLTVYTNPWDDKFTFFSDVRQLPKELKELIGTQRKIESRIFISDFSYQTLRFGYEIDKFLNLTVDKSVLMLIEPYVLRYSGNVPGRNNIQRLRDGLYLLKVAYQKDYLDPAAKGVLIKREERQRDIDGEPLDLFVAKMWDPNLGKYRDLTNDEKRHKTKQHLSIVKKLVRVNNGKIITPITLKVADLRLMRVRSQLLIQLQPVDERLVQIANAYDNKVANEVFQKVKEKFKQNLRANNQDFDNLLKSHIEQNEKERIEAIKRYQEILHQYEKEQEELIRARIQDVESKASLEAGYVPLTPQQIDEYVSKEMQSRRGEFDAYLEKFESELAPIDKARAQFNYLTDREKLEIEEQIKNDQDNLEGLLEKLASDKLLPAQEKALVKMGMDPEGRRVIDTGILAGTAYDKLDKFSPLMEEFDIFHQTKEILKTNDFTLSSAQAHVRDLDILVEPFSVSGLASRTFIGPITFLLNSNRSNVRPTDNIDENFCRTDDCDNFKSWGVKAKGLFLEEDVPEINELEKELKDPGISEAKKSVIKDKIISLQNESNQRRSRNKKYYSSVEHFKGKQVDDLIPVWEESLRKRKMEFEVRSNISNFIDLFGLEFVSLSGEKLKKIKKSCKSIYTTDYKEECLEDYDALSIEPNYLINTFNKLPFNEAGMGLFYKIDNVAKSIKKGKLELKGFEDYKLTKEDLKEMIKSGVMKREIAHGFCAIFMRQLITGSSKDGLRPSVTIEKIFKDYNPFNQSKAEMDKIKKACFDHENDKKKPSFIVDRKVRIHSLEGERPVFRGGKQMNLNVGASNSFHRDERVGFSRGFNIAAAGRFLGDFISDATGVLKMSIDYVSGKSMASGTSIQKATFLVMQNAAFDIKLKDYEQCAVVRWNPEIFINSDAYDIFFKVFENPGKNTYIPGGYFICAGKEKNPEPIYVREHYYYFTQHFTDGDMLDSGDLYNHPWLLGLRGSRDAAAFVSNISTEDYKLYDLQTMSNDSPFWPIKKMIETYLNVLPSFPGLYTIIDQYGEDYPWNELPEASYRRIQDETMETNFGRSVLGMPDFSQMSRFVQEQEDNYIPNREKTERNDDYMESYRKGGSPSLGR
ncbi:MAG: hypothetical protein H6625_11930 [Bdellovibrionaceae bacterium]|nr:hypothetical protein [Pseudobdellovibrionaceae bacterium]